MGGGRRYQTRNGQSFACLLGGFTMSELYIGGNVNIISELYIGWNVNIISVTCCCP